MPTAKEHLNKQVIATSHGFIRRFIGVRHKDKMIDRAKVQTCGMDAWLVSSSDVVVDPKNIVGYGDFIPASELVGRRIISENGTEIATVDSVILDDDGKVRGVTLDKMPESGQLASRKAIAREAISSIGSDTSPMTTTLQDAESIVISPSPPVDLQYQSPG